MLTQEMSFTHLQLYCLQKLSKAECELLCPDSFRYEKRFRKMGGHAFYNINTYIGYILSLNGQIYKDTAIKRNCRQMEPIIIKIMTTFIMRLSYK